MYICVLIMGIRVLSIPEFMAFVGFVGLVEFVALIWGDRWVVQVMDCEFCHNRR